ncbi:nucleotidyltransferase family protein [Teichococcus oryzae]|uniref:nucleotidyltransferase family protein n=1 Tax=Teichococcus oryzae TaxID=1608942 RepID=UPI001F50381F|nr:nucleotidyltransferase family protein [Pseudoroseomonas oryzae]
MARLPALGLRQGYLTAGCMFQAVWNHRAGRPPGWGVNDYDVFYFDDRDLSWEAEDRVIRRAAALFRDLPARVELRNQARVHLWYERRFGVPGPVLRSSRAGIDRYPVACTCVGIALADGALYAPQGLNEIWEGVLRMNPRNPHRGMFRAKAENYRRRWPFLRVLG